MTERPAPRWTVTKEGTGTTGEAVVELSVKIGNETFQLDGSKKSEGVGREKLARMVLKHIRKKDEMANAGQQVTSII